MPVSKFIEEFWQQKPLFIRGAEVSPGRWGDLESAGRWARNESVNVHDGQDRRLLGHREIEAALIEGRDIHITASDLIDWRLQRLAAAFRDEFSYPGKVHVTSILTQSNRPTPVHFDGRAVFNLQITGSKRWLVKDNVTLSWPNYAAYGDAIPYDDLKPWQFELGGEPPTPEALRSFVTKPGDLVYVPSGLWHAVPEVVERPALSVLITFDAEPKVSFLKDVIIDLLETTTSMRCVQPGLKANVETWSMLLDEVATAARELNPHDVRKEILLALSQSPERLLPPHRTHGTVDEAFNGGTSVLFEHAFAGAIRLWADPTEPDLVELFHGPISLELEGERAFLEWIAEHPQFSLQDLKSSGCINEKKIEENLNALINESILCVTKTAAA